MDCDRQELRGEERDVENNNWRYRSGCEPRGACRIAGAAAAQEVLKLGLIQSMTGAFNTSGKAAVNGALLYLPQQARSLPAATSRSPSRMMRRRQMPLKDLLRN